jgi:hypothetical protein
LEIPGGYKVKKELENSEKQIKTGVFHRHTTVAISWIASLRAVPTPTPKLSKTSTLQAKYATGGCACGALAKATQIFKT